MCGIAGWLVTRHGGEVEADVLSRMGSALEHRGPDGNGQWLSPDRRVGLAFRRLAIIDLSSAANQPMANEDGSIRVVFNGEIYNHRALRRELEVLGHRFSTDHSDTETIVHGYEEWGDQVVDHLDGMFAFGVWDASRRRLLLARDRVGVKPLYFISEPGRVLFASEIKALFEHPQVTPRLDPAAVYHYLTFLVTPPPLTLYTGILKLPAGCRAIATEAGELRVERYWDALPRERVASELRGRSSDEQFRWAVRETQTLLDRAVEKRLMSDVPFGVLLSGGIDSSVITALMSRHLSRPVRTFTVGFSDHDRLNELEEARFVSREFRTEHHEVLVDERAMREYLPQLVYSQDEPIADWVCIPLYFVSKLVRDSGTVVVQVGEGSDEQFCGYASYMGYLRLHDRYWRRFRLLPRMVQQVIAGGARAGAGVLERGMLYADIIDRAAKSQEPFWGGAISLWESMKRDLLDEAYGAGSPRSPLVPEAFFLRDSHEVVRQLLARLDARVPQADILTRMIYLEFQQRLPELLLMRVDKITMSTSVEARVPFLDPALVDLTMSLPMSLKIPGARPKHLLKEACRGLIPPPIIERRKKGFGAPMREWLAGDFGREAEATLLRSRLLQEGPFRAGAVRNLFAEHRRGRDRSLPLWTLYNLVGCYDHWVDRPVAA